MAREAWEEVSYQVIHEMDGTIRSGWFPTGSGVVDGNIAVDYVWGNFPLQPDDDRDGSSDSFGGTVGDYGWSSTSLYDSDTLQFSDYTPTYNNVGGTTNVPADSHTIARDNYEGYPEFSADVVQVPWVVNRSYVDGTVAATLAGYGLVVGTVLTTTSEATEANRGKVKAQYPTGDSALLSGSAVDLIVFDTDSTADTIVPSTVGLTDAAAQSAVEDVDLVYASTTTYVGATTANDGKVKSQSPVGGTLVNSGITVNAVVYEAPTVPSVLGDTESDANTALVAEHLIKGTVTTDYVGATTTNDGKVKSQSPASGGKANTGSAVNLVLYAAPTVPDVLGLTEGDAGTALVAAHLIKGTVTTSSDGATAENDGLVKSQTPASGGKADTGSAVALVLYAFGG